MHGRLWLMFLASHRSVSDVRDEKYNLSHLYLMSQSIALMGHFEKVFIK